MLIFLFCYQTSVLNINVSNTEFLPSTFSVLLGVIGGFSIKNIPLHKCWIELYTVKEVEIDSGVLSKDSLWLDVKGIPWKMYLKLAACFGGVFVEDCYIWIPVYCVSVNFVAYGSTCGWLSPFSSMFCSYTMYDLQWKKISSDLLDPENNKKYCYKST